MEDLDVSWGVVSFLAREDGRHHTTIGLGLGSVLACCAPRCGGRRAAAQPRGSRPCASSGGHEQGGGARQQAIGGASGCRRRREDEIDLLGAGCYEHAR